MTYHTLSGREQPRMRCPMRNLASLFIATIFVAVPTGLHSQTNDLIPQLAQLAEAGNAEAIYHLGMAYQTGSGVPQDRQKAFDAFRKAASMGESLASYKLGCYYDGDDALVSRDEQKALELKLVAAEAGYALAQQDVAAMYARRGETARALTWLERSAAQGWSGGIRTLASVYNGAPGIKPNAAKTAGYFRIYLTREGGSDAQRGWLAKFESRMTAKEKLEAEQIVQAFHPVPTALTIRALAGQGAARALLSKESAAR